MKGVSVIDRSQVLDQAKSLIEGNRADQYGSAYDTHRRIAQSWSAILGDRAISPAEVALMMITLKVVRAAKNPQYADSWVDIAGYAALGAEIAEAK